MASRRQDENAILATRRAASHIASMSKKSSSSSTGAGAALGLGAGMKKVPGKMAKSANENAIAAAGSRANVGKAAASPNKALSSTPRGADTTKDEKLKSIGAANRTRTPLTSVPVGPERGVRGKPTLSNRAASSSSLTRDIVKPNAKPGAPLQARTIGVLSKPQEPTISSQSRAKGPPAKPTVTSKARGSSSTSRAPRGIKKLNVYTSGPTTVGKSVSLAAAAASNRPTSQARSAVQDEYEVEYMPPPVAEPSYVPSHLLPPPADELDQTLAQPDIEPDLNLNLDLDLDLDLDIVDDMGADMGQPKRMSDGDILGRNIHANTDTDTNDSLLLAKPDEHDQIEPTLSIPDDTENEEIALGL
ncbi:hypothetical protein IAU59_002784 [Kwoniella sp. CBS 9459]